MTNMHATRCLLTIVLLASYASTSLAGAGPKILIFSKIESGANSPISNEIDAVKSLGRERGWNIDAARDTALFTETGLQKYDVVVWLNTSGTVLTRAQRAAYERFQHSGRGTVAVHSDGVIAQSDNGTVVPQTGERSQASAPLVKEITVINSRPQHPAAFTFPFLRRQGIEQYQLDMRPAADAQVLLTAYDATLPQLFLPISWYQESADGRYVYTMLGGRSQDYADSRFLAHLAGAIEWTAGRLPAKVSRKTDGEALVLQEFDGASPNGVWEKQAPSPDFYYEAKSGELQMKDSSAISMANRHLVRRGLAIDPKRPYAIEGTFSFPGSFDPKKPYSFCVNLNVAGPDGDPGKVNTWAVNIHVLSPGKSVSKFMGFVDGGFFQVGQVENEWGEMGVEYRFEIHVNADLQGIPRDKMVSLKVKKGEAILEAFETDYSGFPYQPDLTQPVRFGLNGHGPPWTLRNLKIYYLDVPAPAQ